MLCSSARREFLQVCVCLLAIALVASAAGAVDSFKPFLDVTEATGLKANNQGVAAWGDFTEAIRLDPVNPQGYVLRAKEYGAIGDHASAASDEQKSQGKGSQA